MRWGTSRYAGAGLLLAVAACTSGAPVADPPATSTTVSSPATVTTSTPTSRPPPPVQPPPTPVDGPCPYLATDFVQETVGQHIERTTFTVTDQGLPPDCAFYRPDGDMAAVVELTAYAGPAQAQTAAIELGTPAANPVDDVGDGGVVLVSEQDAVLAVSVAATLLVVRINQASSLEARTLAATVAPQLAD